MNKIDFDFAILVFLFVALACAVFVFFKIIESAGHANPHYDYNQKVCLEDPCQNN